MTQLFFSSVCVHTSSCLVPSVEIEKYRRRIEAFKNVRSNILYRERLLKKSLVPGDGKAIIWPWVLHIPSVRKKTHKQAELFNVRRVCMLYLSAVTLSRSLREEARWRRRGKRKRRVCVPPGAIKHRKDLASLFSQSYAVCRLCIHAYRIILLIEEQKLFAGDQRVSQREPPDTGHVSRRRHPDRSIRRACPGLQVQVRRSTSASRPSHRGAALRQSANHTGLPGVSRFARSEDRSQGPQGVKLLF